jgi:hypothetical protein
MDEIVTPKKKEFLKWLNCKDGKKHVERNLFNIKNDVGNFLLMKKCKNWIQRHFDWKDFLANNPGKFGCAVESWGKGEGRDSVLYPAICFFCLE